MTAATGSILEMIAVEKRYNALRPLRIRGLAVAPTERVALVGIDAGGAEVLINLVTGASVPDRGQVVVAGKATADIASGDEWLASLDRFGIVSERAVLLEGATLQQNLAMPFTLESDPIPEVIVWRVSALADACGISGEWLLRRAGDAPPETRMRAHLARAVALEPALLILEHPSAQLSPSAAEAFATDVARLCDARRLAALVITQDVGFAGRIAHRTLKLDPVSGALQPAKKGWFW